MAKMKAFSTADAYIKSFPPKVQKGLRAIRRTIRKHAPKATEKMAYGIPTFHLGKNLVHYGAFKTHFSFFPTSSGVAAFKKELGKYDVSKGTIRFPFGKPVPHMLIAKIVRFRVKQCVRDTR